MSKKGYSREGFFGEKIHYDADGNKIGESRKNFSGGYDHFDNNGNKVGSSHENFWGGVNHYDADGDKSGSSYRGFWGQTNHYDTEGNKVGESARNFYGGQNHYGTGDNKQPKGTHTPTNVSDNKPQYNYSKKRMSDGFDELLATVALAGFILFILGGLLGWPGEDVLLYFVLFIASLVWFIVRNK